MAAAAAIHLSIVRRPLGADLEPARAAGRHATARSAIYVSGDYQFARRWFAGARYDRSDARTMRPSRLGPVAAADLLAERVQPGARPVPAHAIRRRAIRRTSCCSSSSFRSVRTVRIRSESRLGKRALEEFDHDSSNSRHALSRSRYRSSRRSRQAQGKLNVITTTEDLAAIAREVGGDRITVESIARGYQDPHFVEAKPSFILKLQKADLLIVVGRELEIGWLPPLIQQSRNAKVQVGRQGYLDASRRRAFSTFRQGQVTRAMGDVHPQGNPHYWLDPENGKSDRARRSPTSCRSCGRTTAPSSISG